MALSSLSARRAWIEIGSGDYVQYNYNVALRKESVDRNITVRVFCVINAKSLSARRAWIEMILRDNRYSLKSVALRKESVDRNMSIPPAA